MPAALWDTRPFTVGSDHCTWFRSRRRTLQGYLVLSTHYSSLVTHHLSLVPERHDGVNLAGAISWNHTGKQRNSYQKE